MDKTLIDKLTGLEASLKELEQDLSKVDISKDPQGYAEMAKRHSDLTQVVDLFNQWKTLNSDITDAQELLTEETDQNTKKEYELIISDSKAQVEGLTSKIKLALLPKDPSDEKDVLVEIRPGAGGEEASIWVGDLYKMYNRYAERNSWKVEKIELIDSDMGGYSKIIFAIKSKGVYSKLKFEAGAHRVPWSRTPLRHSPTSPSRSRPMLRPSSGGFSSTESSRVVESPVPAISSPTVAPRSTGMRSPPYR